MNLKEELLKYQPFNQQEETDLNTMLELLDSGKELYDRNNIAHFTASAWIVNKNRDKVLLAYHPIYHSWAWLGGHADNDTDLLRVCKKEIEEESGVTDLKMLYPTIYSIEILPVASHYRKGEYVPNHLHLNVTYLFEADSDDITVLREDAKWIKYSDIAEYSNETAFIDNIYNKLMAKLTNL